MKNLLEIYKYIKSDYIRYGYTRGGLKMILVALFGINLCFSFSFWLRLCSNKNIFLPFALVMHRRYYRKFGLQISRKTKIGYGLYIGHGVGIVIHPGTIIGNNCNLSQFTTIGTAENKTAIIGNNVYIGPSVCIVDNVYIGDNVSIGAGSVVTKDIPENATVVGVPAKILNFNNPGRYINNQWKK